MDLVEIRSKLNLLVKARESRDYGLADKIREALLSLGPWARVHEYRGRATLCFRPTPPYEGAASWANFDWYITSSQATREQ